MKLLSIEFNQMKLEFDPVRGRKTLYISITILNYTFWFMWWDTDRCRDRKPLWRSGDGLMCATCGVR